MKELNTETLTENNEHFKVTICSKVVNVSEFLCQI